MAHESAAGICEETLIEQLVPGIQMMLRRRVNPDDVRDATQDVLLITLKALRAGSIRNPEALPGFVRTVTVRIAAQRVADYSRGRRETETSDLLALAGALGRPPEQERDLLALEDHQLAQRLLATLKPREREVLDRYYVNEEPKEAICAAMGLSETQFRLLKSRARQRMTQRFAEVRAASPSGRRTGWSEGVAGPLMRVAAAGG